MDGPIAFLFTWTCYGTWLHGDQRGSVDDDHNKYTMPMLAPNARLERFETSAMKHGAINLDHAQRQVVQSSIEEHCAHKKWGLRALNVRTNHAHCVVGAVEPPGKMVGSIKAWATRRLRESGLVAPNATVWTADASKRWLWDEESVYRAVDYVLNRQGPHLG